MRNPILYRFILEEVVNYLKSVVIENVEMFL